MKKEYIRPFLWGGAVGAIVLLIVIFSAGWVVTSGSAEMKAKQMVTSAVMNRLVLSASHSLCRIQQGRAAR